MDCKKHRPSIGNFIKFNKIALLKLNLIKLHYYAMYRVVWRAPVRAKGILSVAVTHSEFLKRRTAAEATPQPAACSGKFSAQPAVISHAVTHLTYPA